MYYSGTGDGVNELYNQVTVQEFCFFHMLNAHLKRSDTKQGLRGLNESKSLQDV